MTSLRVRRLEQLTPKIGCGKTSGQFSAASQQDYCDSNADAVV
jgi:hypothetical protein